jgi:hypothetical protein
MADVFVSYAEATRDRVEPIVRALEASHLSVWWDQHLRLDEAYGEAINRELDGASCVLVAWNTQSASQATTKAEAARGRERGKLIQVVLDETSPPKPFDAIPSIDFTAWRGDPNAEALKKVLLAAASVQNSSSDAGIHVAPLIRDLGLATDWNAGGNEFTAALEHARAVIEWAFHDSDFAKEWRTNGFGLSQFQKACEVRDIAYVDLGFDGAAQFARYVCTGTPWRVLRSSDGHLAIQHLRRATDPSEPPLSLHSQEYYRVILYRRPKRIHPVPEAEMEAILNVLKGIVGPWGGNRLQTELVDRSSATLNPISVRNTLWTLRNCDLIQFHSHSGGIDAGQYTIPNDLSPAATLQQLRQIAKLKVELSIGACAPDVLHKTLERGALSPV